MKIQVLDHGYVEFIEAWGHGRGGSVEMQLLPEADFEIGVIEAARQSTQGAFRGWEQDAKLLKHLYNNNHATPFEFAGMVIEVQAPIFVFREWHRHRTQSYNEMSARYAPLPDLYYEPLPGHVLDRAHRAYENKNKQAASEFPPDLDAIEQWLKNSRELTMRLEAHYKAGLAIGVPKEIARIDMPVKHYSRMRAHANLRNWLAFMTLRCDPLAQWEIQQFAGAVRQLVAHAFPQTHALWTERMPQA